MHFVPANVLAGHGVSKLHRKRPAPWKSKAGPMREMAMNRTSAEATRTGGFSRRTMLMAGSALGAAAVALPGLGSAASKAAAAGSASVRSVRVQNNAISLAGRSLPARQLQRGRQVCRDHHGPSRRRREGADRGPVCAEARRAGLRDPCLRRRPPRRQRRRTALPRRPDEARDRHLQRRRLPDLAPVRGREPHRCPGRLRRQRHGRQGRFDRAPHQGHRRR